MVEKRGVIKMIAEIEIGGIRKVKGVDGNLYSIRFAINASGELAIVEIVRVKVERFSSLRGELLVDEETVCHFEISK